MCCVRSSPAFTAHEDMPPVRWTRVSVALWLYASTPLVAGLSSWLPCKPPIERTFGGRCLRSGPSPARADRVAGTQRLLTLACNLDDLRALQREKGGVVGDVAYDSDQVCHNVLLSGSAESSFGERTEAAEQALESATLLTDQSHWGVIRVGGEDRLRFLHSQGTNAFEGVAEGTVVSTCFTTNVGRVVDFCQGVVLRDEVWLLSSPHRWQRLLQTMDKFIFPMDKTTVSSLSDDMAIFSLAGAQAANSLALADCPASPSHGRSVEWEFEGIKVIAIAPSRPMASDIRNPAQGAEDGPSEGLPAVGHPYYTLLVPMAISAKVWSVLSASSSVVAAGEEEWQALRIKRGFPFPGKELTNDYNPLEAGLWHSVHFDKGCYIGQESISRVNAYNAVKNGLFGVSFEEPGVPEGARLVAEETGKRAGVVTSMMDPDAGSGPFGLAYIKTLAGGVGLKVATEQGVRGTVTQVPYPTRSDAESAMPPVKPKDERAEAAAVSLDAEDEKAKEKARKAAKLEAMQKKLDALKARRKATP